MRDLLFLLYDAQIPLEKESDTGSPETGHRQIMPTDILQQGLACDFNQILKVANNHADLSAFLGYDIRFELCRTISEHPEP